MSHIVINCHFMSICYYISGILPIGRCSIYYIVVFPNFTPRRLGSTRDRSWPLLTNDERCFQ